MSFPESTLTCPDCGQRFANTARQQQAFANRGREPRRCPSCRHAQKTVRSQKLSSFWREASA